MRDICDGRVGLIGDVTWFMDNCPNCGRWLNGLAIFEEIRKFYRIGPDSFLLQNSACDELSLDRINFALWVETV